MKVKILGKEIVIDKNFFLDDDAGMVITIIGVTTVFGAVAGVLTLGYLIARMFRKSFKGQ